MKKRIFLTLAVVFVLACALAFSVSAAETNEFSQVEIVRVL